MYIFNFVDPIFLLQFFRRLHNHPKLIVFIEERNEKYSFACIVMNQSKAIGLTDSEKIPEG